MAAKGTIAKEQVIKKLQEAFGEDFIGEYDKKIYVYAKENGEKVQVALSLTCPKVPIAAFGIVPSGKLNFEEPEKNIAVAAQPTVEYTAEERKNIEDLLASLGL